MIAARSRAFASGSGRPIFAATVISRLSFENRAERFLSCAPFRYMMFLYFEWPAMNSPQSGTLREPRKKEPPLLLSLAADRCAIGFEHGVLLLPGVGLHLPEPHDHAHDLWVISVRLGFGIDVANVVGDALLFFFKPLDPLDE